MTTVTTWVVGATGLLGSAVVRRLVRSTAAYATVQVPWTEPDRAVPALLAGVADVATAGPWQLAWCAGAGVIGTSQSDLDHEVAVLGRFLDGLGEQIRTGAVEAPRAVFLASSAGGVYAGSVAPPFDESTVAAPISPYGVAKQAGEQRLRDFAVRHAIPTLIGRIANLYGPGQDLAKPQGLVSQLCKAQLTRRPLSIYVSLDTSRDYLFVDDAAAMVLAGLDAAAARGGCTMKILATQRPTSVAAILGELRRVTKRRPLVVLGASPNAKFQARDLRFRSAVWPDLDAHVRTPLGAGIAATLESLTLDLGAGRIRA